MHVRFRLIPWVLVLMALGGCTALQPPAGATPTSTLQSATQSASADDTARSLVDPGAMTDLDPATACFGEFKTFANVYETLTKFNPPGSAEEMDPGLATSWTHSSDGRTWTFKLRQGVKFHDGSEFNSGAVKYTIERYQAAGACSSYLLAPIANIETPDPYTVVFHLDKPVALDTVLANTYQSWMMSPAAVANHGKEWFAEGHDAGSGPYRITRYEPGQRLVFQRFDDYWGGWQPNQIDTVINEVVADPAVAEQMVAAGQADFVTSVSLTPEQMVSLAESGDYHLDASPSSQNIVIYLNHSRAPTNDVHVRQALSYSFPYEEVLASHTLGKSTLPTGPVPGTVWGHRTEAWPYTYDPEKAKSLLAEAGYAGGLELKLSYVAGWDTAAELWQAALAKIGVKLTLEAADFSMLWDTAKAGPDNAPQAMAIVWLPDIVDPYSYLFNLFHSEEKPFFNLGYYKNPAFDALVDEAHTVGVTDRATATEKYIAAQDTLAADAAAILPEDLAAFHLIRSDLTGYVNNLAYPEAIFWHKVRRTPPAH